MRRLTILYDSTCGFCVWCRHWLERQAQLVQLEFVPARSTAVARRFPALAGAGRTDELIVVDDEGGVYRDADAWVMCLYALDDYREWALRLASPAWRPHAKAIFKWISAGRSSLSRWLALQPEEPPETNGPTCAAEACDRPGEAGFESEASESGENGFLVFLVGAVLGAISLKPWAFGLAMASMAIASTTLALHALQPSRRVRAVKNLMLLWAGYASLPILAAVFSMSRGMKGPS